jgi:HK97 family phage portal protein
LVCLRKAGDKGMGLRNLFEIKSNRNSTDGGMYPQIVALHGKTSPQYTSSKYIEIARSGYSENWIIFRCLQEIIKAAIQLDWKVMQYDKSGVPKEVKNHPAQVLLNNPNKVYGKGEFIKRMIAFYYIAGDVPLVKGIAGGQVKEIFAYRPDKISITLTGDQDQPYDNIRYEGQLAQDIDPTNFTLWKCFDPLDEYDGLGRGMSPLKPVLRNGDLLNAMIDWNVSLLQNGGSLSGIISTDAQLSDAVYKRSKAELKNNHQGRLKVGKYLFLEGGAKFFPTTNSPKDMDWAKGKEAVMKDICIGIGVDPIVIGFNDQSTYNNKNEAMKALYTNVAIPLMQECGDCLGNFLGLEDNQFLEPDYSKIPVLQDDIKLLNDKLNNNEMTINEKREARGLEKVKGGDIVAPQGSYAIVDGEVYLPMNLVSINDNGPQDNQQDTTQVDDSHSQASQEDGSKSDTKSNLIY